MTGHGLSLVFKNRIRTVSMIRDADTAEAIMRDQRRRRWSLADKNALVRRSYEPGMGVWLVARQEGIAASLLFQWCKLKRQGALTAVSAGEVVVPAFEFAVAGDEISKIQCVLADIALFRRSLDRTVQDHAHGFGQSAIAENAIWHALRTRLSNQAASSHRLFISGQRRRRTRIKIRDFTKPRKVNQ